MNENSLALAPKLLGDVHGFDREFATHFLDSYLELIAQGEETLARSSVSAYALHTYWLRHAYVSWGLRGDREVLRSDLTKAARALALVFAASEQETGSPVPHRLLDNETTCRAIHDLGSVTTHDWINAVHAAMVVGDSESLAQLMKGAQVIQSPGRGARYELLYAQALEALLKTGSPSLEALFEAMEATDPERLSEDEIDEALVTVAPEIMLMAQIGGEDYDAFRATLEQTTTAHIEHHSQHTFHWRSFLRLGAAALLSIARQQSRATSIPENCYVPQLLR